MTEEAATLDAVRDAMHRVRLAGDKVTYESVRAVLKRGSKPHVLMRMRQVRAEEEAETSSEVAPEVLLELSKPLVAQIYAAASKAAAAKYDDATARYHRSMGEMEAQIDELATDESKLQRRLGEAEAALAAKIAEVAGLTEQMDKLQREIISLRGAATAQQEQHRAAEEREQRLLKAIDDLSKQLSEKQAPWPTRARPKR